jgi:DNA repair protein RecO (recombination protein O)
LVALSSEAIILRCVDFGESDRILHLLVPEVGRLPVIAKGARRSVRRFSGVLDLFHHVRIQVDRRRSNALGRLDQARLVQPFTALREDPARFAMACYLLELVDRVAPEGGVRQDMRRLFDFALRALTSLTTRTPDARLRTLLELRALDALGLRPELSRCVRCGEGVQSGAVVDFQVAEGGVVCARCGRGASAALTAHPGTLRALEQGLRLDFDKLDRLAMGGASLIEARRILERFQRFHLGFELRSERFLDQVIPAR